MTMTWSMLAIDEGAPAVVAHAAMARMRAIRTATRCRGMDRSIECARCRPPSSPTCCSGGPARPRFPWTLSAGRLGAVRDDALRDGGVERFVLVIADDVVQLPARLHSL